MSAEDLGICQFPVLIGTRLYQPQHSGLALENEEHAVGQQIATLLEGGLALAGPDNFPLVRQTGEKAPLVAAYPKEVSVVDDGCMDLGIPDIRGNLNDGLGQRVELVRSIDGDGATATLNLNGKCQRRRPSFAATPTVPKRLL